MSTTVNGDNIQNSNSDRVDAVHLLDTQTASSSASIDFVLPSGYFKFDLVYHNVAPATDNVLLYLRTSTDGGSTFDSGAADYGWVFNEIYGTNTNLVAGDVSDSQIVLSRFLGTGANESCDGCAQIINPAASSYTRILNRTAMLDYNVPTHLEHSGSGYRISAADVDAIQLLMSSGNISSGTFKLYGWVA